MGAKCLSAVGLDKQDKQDRALSRRSFVLHIKDPPSTIWMRPQWAVAGGGTSKSGGGTGKAIHAMLSIDAILFSSPMLQSHTSAPTLGNIIMSSMPTPQLSLCSYFSIPHFFNENLHCSWFISLHFFQFEFFRSGQMAKFLHGQSESYL